MTTMTHDEMIAVIQAHKEGKEIEFRHNNCLPWVLVKEPRWNFPEGEYRVKQKKIEAWGVVVNGEITTVEITKEYATDTPDFAFKNGKLIRLIQDPNWSE